MSARVNDKATFASKVDAARREDGPKGYRAVDGDWIAIPPLATPPEDGPKDVAPWSRSAAAPGLLSRAEALGQLSGGDGETLADRISRAPRSTDPRDALLWAYLQAPGADLRWLERLDLARRPAFGHPAERRQMVRGDLMRAILSASYRRETGPSAFQPDALWPLVAASLDVFDEVFDAQGLGSDADRHATVISYLRELPKLPMRHLPSLVLAALTQPKEMRRVVRSLLSDIELAGVGAMAALDDPASSVRIEAAGWLAEREDPHAVGALQTRLAREDAPPPRAALISALARLGADAQVTVDRAALEEAAQAAKPKSSKLLSTLSPRLPTLRYANGDQVPPRTLKWLLAQAIAIETPGGSHLVDLYLDLFDPEDATALSIWALRGWIDYDAARPSDAEAAKKALKTLGLTAPPENDAHFERAKARAFSKYVRNGYSSRGVLALGVRAPDAEAGFLIRGYLERHGTRSGTRSAQGGALLELAATIAGPSCLEALAWTSRQTKHQGLASLAASLLDGVRRARGWSAQEMADRIAPDLGFDRDGAQCIDVRADAPPYRARLDEALRFHLENPSGKQVKALPAGKDPQAKAARSRVSGLKKALAATLSHQTDRLFGAMCVERVWRVEDWRTFVRAHPIVGRLAQRLVWLAGPGATAIAFRPTPEGDLTDATDAPVSLDGVSEIRLAHGSLVDAALAEAWPAHLADYEVTPLFDQFGRPTRTLSGATSPRETRLTDRNGWRMDATTFMKHARARGYAPTATGRHYLYEYAFPTLRRVVADVTVSLQPNGPPPQEGGEVTLTGVEFDRPLRSLPAILLSEVRNDYEEITASATSSRR